VLAEASPRLKLRPPPAAFYLYADCSAALGLRTPQGDVIRTDIDLARYLLEKAGVAVVPGNSIRARTLSASWPMPCRTSRCEPLASRSWPPATA